jgi:hypothetical protein
VRSAPPTSPPRAGSSPSTAAASPPASSPPNARGGSLDVLRCAGVDGTWSYLFDEDDGAGGRIRNYHGNIDDIFTCMAQVGTGGCGFEHTLEATARAVETLGPIHSGFRRDDALLLIVIVSDEDDCSAADASLFADPTADSMSVLGPRTSFRCFEFGVACAEQAREVGDKTACTPLEGGYFGPVAQYAERIRAAVAHPSQVMVAGIHGGTRGITVVQDPERLDNPDPTFAVGTLCPGTDFEVTPALRLTAFAEEFPARWVVTPECPTTMSAKLSTITRTATSVLGRSTCFVGGRPDVDACKVTRTAADGTGVDIPRCGPGSDGVDCYRIEADSAACGHTAHHLRLVMPPALMPRGERVQVRCGD